MLKATPEDIDRFMRYVERLPNGCWVWTGARSRGKGNRKWYGSFRLGKRAVRAHRFAAEVLGQQPCPTGHHRDHLCRFSLCVNPAHIETVHSSENQRRKLEGHPPLVVDARDPVVLIEALHRLGYDVLMTAMEVLIAERAAVAGWRGTGGCLPLLYATRPRHEGLPWAD